jgi:hypothetical protein
VQLEVTFRLLLRDLELTVQLEVVSSTVLQGEQEFTVQLEVVSSALMENGSLECGRRLCRLYLYLYKWTKWTVAPSASEVMRRFSSFSVFVWNPSQ